MALVERDHVRSVRVFARVGAADCPAEHLDDELARTRRGGFGNRFDPNVARPVVDGSAHGRPQAPVWMWTLMLRDVSRAAWRASSAESNGKVALMIAVGSTTPLARNRIVFGQMFGDPITPRIRRSFDWMSPSCAGALPPMSIPTYTRRAD